MMNVWVIHGPNLNLLGYRDPEIYGNITLKELEEKITDYGKKNGIDISCFQSNHEGDIIDQIQDAYNKNIDGMIINAGAYSHYSYAIRDALEICAFPIVEVHLSNVTGREDFRKKLVLSDVCDTTIYGKGIDGYRLAIDFLLDMHKRI